MKKMAISVTTALLLAACSDKPPATIKDIDSHIVSTTEIKDGERSVLKITWKSDNISPESDMNIAVSGINQIIRGIVTQLPNEHADEVHIIINSSLTDKYGNQSRADTLDIPFSMSEVRKINFASNTFTQWDLINLSEQPKLLHNAGKQLMAAYCTNETYAKYAQRFCLKGLRL
ncbi:hypothetical protein [Burkholderia gladioli]|uniref:hypothetical protein n=1 Tax=Burkholderia gladioli TaxID=28095 RepID=UPI001641D79D|nr:hypothetical protein [Burkholderia gladioli]